MTSSTSIDRPLAELTELASSIHLDTMALAERAMKHDSEARAIARVRADLSKRAASFAKLANESRTLTAALIQPTAKVVPGNGAKPITKTATAQPVKMKSRKRKAKGKAKYRNPANPTQTWTGMGTVPDFIRSSGKPKEAFLIA